MSWKRGSRERQVAMGWIRGSRGIQASRMDKRKEKKAGSHGLHNEEKGKASGNELDIHYHSAPASDV